MRDAESPRTRCGAALLRREWMVLPTPAAAPVDSVVLSFRPTAQAPTQAPSLSSEAHRADPGSTNE
jgi:hypothetical protein